MCKQPDKLAALEAIKRKGKYAVKWGYSFEQKNLTKSEALKVAASLLRSYEIVLISKE
jgi:enolase